MGTINLTRKQIAINRKVLSFYQLYCSQFHDTLYSNEYHGCTYFIHENIKTHEKSAVLNYRGNVLLIIANDDIYDISEYTLKSKKLQSDVNSFIHDCLIYDHLYKYINEYII